jgi:transcription-repair coupling factor (superfamily II helicase)
MPLGDLAKTLGEPPRRVTLFGAPEGHDAATLGALLRDGGLGAWLHVCRDDGRMARFAAALQFFHPGLMVLTFPAWDCLPYDRVSPNGEITSRRIDTLTRLAGGAEAAPVFVLTTVNALVQRVPPRRLFDGRVLTLGPGGRIPLDRLQCFSRNTGYPRTDTVREPGEFAIRGGIVDLYAAGAAQPVRLDFFGDSVESLRSFDPLTQRSTGTLDRLELKPVSEVLLDEQAIHRFRTRYRELFGNVGGDDALYESVSAGRRYAGMEHWLPLYYEQLETLFDYLPGAALSFDYQAEEAREHRLESIADFYAARQSIAASGASTAAPLYRPVKPEQMFIGDDKWGAVLSRRSTIQLSPFAAPDSDREAFDARARLARSFGAERADPKIQLFEAVRDYLEAERKSGKRAAIAAYSVGAADRLATVLRERGLGDLRTVADGDALA